MKSVFLVSAILGLTACAGGRSGDDKEAVEITVNGMKPTDYFGQFITQVKGNCETKDLDTYFLSAETLDYGQDQNGRDVKIELEVYLEKDGTYQAVSEMRRVHYYVSVGYAYDVLGTDTMVGRWGVTPEGHLQIGDLGTGKALQYNHKPAVQFEVNQISNARSLKGEKTALRWSSRDSTDQEIREFCQ